MRKNKIREIIKRELERLPIDIYRKLTDELYDGVYFVTKNRKIIFWNKYAQKITGFSKNDILGKRCHSNILQHIDKYGRKLCLTEHCPLYISIKTNKPCSDRVYLRRKDGVRVPVDIHTTPIRYHGKTIGALEVFRDASAYERIEQQRNRAKNLSLMDTLTSLPNRRRIDKKLRFELNKFKKYKDDLHVAVADIDHFKRINDTYGHKAGDLILRKIAYILESNLRVVDFVGRYGGEEFLIILPNTPKHNCDIALERIRSRVESSNLIEGKGKITISIGVSKAIRKDNPETIFKRADKALYGAKNSGRNKIRFI